MATEASEARPNRVRAPALQSWMHPLRFERAASPASDERARGSLHAGEFLAHEAAAGRPMTGYSEKNVRHRARLARRAPAPLPATIPPLPAGSFEIVYADPPWHYYGSAIKDAAAAKHYPLMSQGDLARLPVREHHGQARGALHVGDRAAPRSRARVAGEEWNLYFAASRTCG